MVKGRQQNKYHIVKNKATFVSRDVIVICLLGNINRFPTKLLEQISVQIILLIKKIIVSSVHGKSYKQNGIFINLSFNIHF